MDMEMMNEEIAIVNRYYSQPRTRNPCAFVTMPRYLQPFYFDFDNDFDTSIVYRVVYQNDSDVDND
jgi:hypothetical protein